MARVSILLAGVLTTLACNQSHAESLKSIDRTTAEQLPAAPPAQWKVTPYYPEGAANAKLDGLVVLVLRISNAGGVEEIGVLSEDPGGYGFGQFAADAVQQWVYGPNQPGLYRQSVKFRYNLK